MKEFTTSQVPPRGARVFISYAREDRWFAECLFWRLKDRGFAPWVDRLCISEGVVWNEAVKNALRGCNALLVLASPDANSSVAVTYEYAFAQALGKPIFPVLVRGGTLPEMLGALQYFDFSREENYPWTTLFEKLIAAHAPESTENWMDPQIEGATQAIR